ncbi:MAG: hypothetical protein AAF211_24575 [Myxococcota bacterium]
MWIWLLGTFAMAEPQFADHSRDLLGDGELDRDFLRMETSSVEVLAIHATRPLVAYKRFVHHTFALGPEPADCDYAGMEDDVRGVQLGVYDLQAGKMLHSWWIYPLAKQEKACLSHEASQAALKSAKATFAELGLDITKPPKALSLSEVGLEARDSVATQLSPDKPREKDPVRLSLWRGDEEVYVREHEQSYLRSVYLRFKEAYEVNGHVVVMESVLSAMVSRGGKTSYTFTPLLPSAKP